MASCTVPTSGLDLYCATLNQGRGLAASNWLCDHLFNGEYQERFRVQHADGWSAVLLAVSQRSIADVASISQILFPLHI